MSSIYELSDQFRELAEMAADSEDMAQAIRDTWESVELAFEDKAEAYAKIITADKGEIAALKAEEQRLAQRRQAYDNRVKRMTETLYEAMVNTGKIKFKTTLYSFGIQANPPAVVVDDKGKLPAAYIRTVEEIDKAALRDALKAGQIVPGARLEQGESLRIR